MYKCVKGHFTNKEHDGKNCPYDNMSASELSSALVIDTEQKAREKYQAKNPESKEREMFINKMNLPHFEEVQEQNFVPDLDRDNFKIKDNKMYEQGEILGVKRGNVMTFAEADNNNVNPNYKRNGSYRINCQSCVPLFEARLRGYDLEVLPYKSHNSVFEELAQNPELIYKNAKIMHISLSKKTKNGEFYRVNLTTELSKIINNNERFNMSYNWLNYYTGEMGGHILECHKINDKLNLYDPQSNCIYKDSDIDSIIGIQACNIKIFRVDNLKFDVEKLSQICKKRSCRDEY